MKFLRFALPLCVPLALLACSPPSALAQSPAQKPCDPIKSLAGTWEDTLTTFPAAAGCYPGCAGRSETAVDA
ncbi:MAG TPA: hypothetical protein VHV80_11370 [Steroidobacteraceae bacterium]|nr:hypothetical protein [Steroidobacteraceae bacterium]